MVVAGLITLIATTEFATPTDTSMRLAVTPDDHKRGAENSAVVLIEYLDFECEACGAYFPVLEQLKEEFGDRVTFVSRYFPLSGHKNGLPAALAVEAASRQGKYHEMYALLFTRQDEWGEKAAPTPEIFETYAQELGLNIAQFKTDFSSEEVRARVERDREEGAQLGVNSTPSFFLNGTKLKNPQSLDAFRSVLEAELED